MSIAECDVPMLFEQFDLIRESTDAVSKLRELVLELAIRGKLIEQDNSDEPAAVLLERVAAERAMLVKSKQCAKRTVDKIDETNAPFTIPANWMWTRLGSITRDFGQKKPDVPFTYIDVAIINKELGLISDAPKIIQPNEAPSRARKLVANGTVIYSTVRPYLLNVAVVNKDFDPSPIVSTAFGILHPLDKISNRFVYSYLRSPAFIKYVESEQSGIAYPAINDGKLYNGPIPIPPLAEQKRIVAKVDTLMGMCDQLQASLDRERELRAASSHSCLIALTSSHEPSEGTSETSPPSTKPASTSKKSSGKPKPKNGRSADWQLSTAWKRLCNHFEVLFDVPETLSDLRQSILQLAAYGLLGTADPKDTAHPPFIKRFEDGQGPEMRSGRKKVETLPKIAEDELPYPRPFGWCWVRLGNVINIEGGSQPPKSKFIYEPKESYVRLVQIRDFKSDSNPTYIPKELANRPFVETDVMIGRYGPPVFQILRGLSGSYNVALMKADPRCDLISRDFLFFLLQEPRIQRKVIEESERTAGQSGVRKELLNNFVVGLPPQAEQKRIVAKVSSLQSHLDELERQQVNRQATAQQLLTATIHQILEGASG